MTDNAQSPKLQTRLPLLLAATLAVGMLIGQKLPHYDRNFSLESHRAASSGTLEEILRYVEAKYVGGLTLQVARELRYMDDHAYGKLLVKKFGFLEPLNKRAGGLMNHVVDNILPDFQKLLPTDLIDTFKNLLSIDLQ